MNLMYSWFSERSCTGYMSYDLLLGLKLEIAVWWLKISIPEGHCFFQWKCTDEDRNPIWKMAMPSLDFSWRSWTKESSAEVSGPTRDDKDLEAETASLLQFSPIFTPSHRQHAAPTSAWTCFLHCCNREGHPHALSDSIMDWKSQVGLWYMILYDICLTNTTPWGIQRYPTLTKHNS